MLGTNNSVSSLLTILVPVFLRGRIMCCHRRKNVQHNSFYSVILKIPVNIPTIQFKGNIIIYVILEA